MATAYPFKISPEMYREQRQRLGSSIRAELGDTHAALVMAGSEVPINSTDCNYLFVQESYFSYLFGLDMPDCYGAVLADGTGIIFIPRLPEDFATWMGVLPTPASVKEKTLVEEVYYVDEMTKVLSARCTMLEVMSGVNSDSGIEVLLPVVPKDWKKEQVSTAWLYNALSEQRVHKTAEEVKVLEYVCGVSSRAHVEVMQLCKPGMSQHQLESTFLHHVYYHGGCRKVSYTCICATGHHGATLHYPNNDAPIMDGQMALLDMGGNYCGYAADITCSFPVNGKFTPAQKLIYTAVLEAHDRVMATAKPGVSWVEMHRLALQVMCGHLVEAGILLGKVEELMEKQIMQFFQPHGLGHLIGLDVHDVGGYLPHCPPRPSEKDCCKLRFARVLEENMYITIEPGCYFNHALLTNAMGDEKFAAYFNQDKIRKEFWDFGGVRIESDVLVTADGARNLTRVPRLMEDIERVMSGEPFTS
ncbi:Xaa-Pro dipeptidase [Angomonas deanei]|uniref:Xaa-Pro dipeptidase n=1 Tax=Angomonas deanei TaxID=59799 RepID=S9VIY3_9TRYP|nr:Xaa-Pro dipeptidase [Angomonas deanei]EPY43292.1 Xaa-Pro dipeptidase [Angomonas deanei]CAD2216803.1 Aminopeptidase P, N-terminal domain/Metallopeptidase family M24, putative [Angomonas deanei]|eukprot:EPY40843.1 Xaa-Pro dipeptidase [Angomonas deanei]